MSDYKDITPTSSGFRKLSYTCRCGWVDWNHALPGAAQGLKSQFDSQTCSDSWVNKIKFSYRGAPAFMVYFSMAAGRPSIKVGTGGYWAVRKGLSQDEKQRIAYYIFRSTSLDFEDLQGTFPFSWMSDSSYSLEDLPSNVVGFYAAYNGKSQDDMRKLCGETTVAESQAVYKANFSDGIGKVKNNTFDPKFYDCSACPKPHAFAKPIDDMTTISPGALYCKMLDNPRYTKHYDNWSNTSKRTYKIENGRIKS